LKLPGAGGYWLVRRSLGEGGVLVKMKK